MTVYIKYFFYLILILISITLFFSDFYESNKVVQTEKIKSKTEETKDSLNIIENINYSSFDNEGNRYLIEAKTGEINQNNFDKIKMSYVYAKITFVNQEFIEIVSNYAYYNRETSETLFYDEVLSSYLDHKISSNELQLLFDDKLVKIKDNVVYISDEGRLEADKVLLNLINKKAQISMNNSEEKVKISYLN
tara:strand:- start:241 stop:816 length:576 start_codon:yes stop_codon:yes gene_type:complete